ncbi:hypothetical protein ES705_44235 [subsurface metagenome]
MAEEEFEELPHCDVWIKVRMWGHEYPVEAIKDARKYIENGIWATGISGMQLLEFRSEGPEGSGK